MDDVAMSGPEDDSNDLDALLTRARRRLMRLEIEKHRTKAEVARLEAVLETRAAQEVARLLEEHSDDLAFATALAACVDHPSRMVSAKAAEAATDAAGNENGAPDGSNGGTTSSRAPVLARPRLRMDAPHTSSNPPHASPAIAAPPSLPAVRVGKPNSRALKERPTTHRTEADPRSRSVRPRSVGRRNAVRPNRQPRTPRRKSPWVTSVIVHAVALCVFGLITIAVMQEQVPKLAATIGLPSEIEVAELPDVEIVPPEESEVEIADPLPLDEVAADFDPIQALSLASPVESLPLAAAGEFAFAELPLGDSALLEAGGSGDASGSGESVGDGDDLAFPAASFFGAEARASRVVFVVDNSNSMDEGRFETALVELARSVEALSPKQSFYVIFYSDTAYRLFHPLAVESLVPATAENKLRLREWLGTVEMCLGGRLVDAIEIAEELRPQVVYLLSDGVIGGYPVSYLTERKNWDFTVHTVGMTVPDREAAGNLMAIAEANGGVFRPVGVTPLAREMARRRPVKKNRARGEVWGIKLRP